MASPAADEPSLAPGSRHALSGLLHLPNELLRTISAYLIPDPPSTTRFALRPAGSWEFREATAQCAEWRARHRDLQALAGSCHRMAAVAGPYQYHTVVVHSGASIVRLFRRLVEKPDTKQWIHNISCLVNLLDSNVISAAKHEWAVQISQGFRIPSDLFLRHPVPSTALRLPPPSPNSDNGIAVFLFNFLVGYADNLTDLLLAYPDEAGAAMNEALETLLWDPITRSRTKGPSQFPETQLFPTMAALRRLKSLRLYCHREEAARDNTYTQGFVAYLVRMLPELPALKTLEVCCDASSAWSSLHELKYPKLPALETLRLYGSRIHEPELVALCGTFVNLRTLVVHFEESADDERDRWRLPGGITLNDALLGLAGTLQHLELVALNEGHYLTRGDERPRKRENHRLTCFPELFNLRHLTIDYRGLFGTLGILEYDDGERLRHLLPASLRSFTLVCEWGTEKDFKPVYLANLDMMIHGVKLLCTSTSPKLSSIDFALQTWPETSKYRTKFRRNLDDIIARCDKAGIHFRTYELLPRYRDEDELVAEAGGDDSAGGDDEEEEEEGELEEAEEEEEEDSDYYFSGDGGDDGEDFERDARRPASFEEFHQLLGENHGHDPDELYYAYHEDRWDEYLF